MNIMKLNHRLELIVISMLVQLASGTLVCAQDCRCLNTGYDNRTAFEWGEFYMDTCAIRIPSTIDCRDNDWFEYLSEHSVGSATEDAYALGMYSKTGWVVNIKTTDPWFNHESTDGLLRGDSLNLDEMDSLSYQGLINAFESAFPGREVYFIALVDHPFREGRTTAPLLVMQDSIVNVGEVMSMLRDLGVADSASSLEYLDEFIFAPVTGVASVCDKVAPKLYLRNNELFAMHLPVGSRLDVCNTNGVAILSQTISNDYERVVTLGLTSGIYQVRCQFIAACFLVVNGTIYVRASE